MNLVDGALVKLGTFDKIFLGNAYGQSIYVNGLAVLLLFPHAPQTQTVETRHGAYSK